MTVTVTDLRVTAAHLRDTLDVYDRFVDGWPYEDGSVPGEAESYLAKQTTDTVGSETPPGITLVERITELYRQARKVEGIYVQRTRANGRRDWSRILTETEPIRKAARRVHTSGYGVDPATGRPGYLLPEEMCPAYRVSMNGGSSPITYEKRVAQYRAVADRFDVSPAVVYHPGSGHDVSPSAAFPESRVVYVDVDEAAMTELNRAGYEAVGADASGYDLEEYADVIVLRNVGLFEEAVVVKNLRPGGWVFANDHLESARHLSRLDSLELIGVVPEAKSGESFPVVTKNLDSYRSQIETRRGIRYRDGSPPDPRSAVGTTESGTTSGERSPLDLYVFRRDS